MAKLFGGAEGQEVLRAFDGVLEAAEELLEVFAALDEIDVGGVDDEEVGGGVAEEEVFVGVGYFFDVFEGDVVFVARGFFGDAGAEDFWFGLQVDDEIGSGDVFGENFEVALIEFEFFVIEIEVGEDAVFFEQEIGEDGAGSFHLESFADTLLAFHQEIHLGAQGSAWFLFIEIGEEWVVFAVVDAAGVKAFGEDFGESGFPDAERAFDDDEAGRLRATLWDRSTFGGGGVVGRHLFETTAA
jgi:hypothetical protein